MCKNIKIISFFLLMLPMLNAVAQSVADVPFPLIGKVKPRNATEIKSSNWTVGAETLDRDYADYDQYKEFLVPLGIKRIRLQGGWAKTEKEKGKYNWAWLDHIIHDATERGLQPWVQFSYGNSIYEGGGGINLAAGIPESEEALAAWDNWVAAMVTRYKDKVKDWQVWNEPNFGGSNGKSANLAEATAAFNIRTLDIVKKIQPDARVSGMTMGHIDLDYADKFLKTLADSGRLKQFHDIVYHDYVYNPDSHYPKVMQLRAILDQYAPEIPLRQGENGAPSMGGPGRGAIGNHDWSELSQAKWDTRRMLGDLGHDIQSSVFTIIDIAYTAGPITKLNVKGLIQSDSTKKAIRPKIAYFAVQNVASIFDHSLERIKNVKQDSAGQVKSQNNSQLIYSLSTDIDMAFYAYQKKQSGLHLYTIWKSGDTPNNLTERQAVDITVANAKFKEPVYVDIISGNIYAIPMSSIIKKGGSYQFKNIPVYDAPVLIADKSLIQIIKK
jgi:hypothetical protein